MSFDEENELTVEFFVDSSSSSISTIHQFFLDVKVIFLTCMAFGRGGGFVIVGVFWSGPGGSEIVYGVREFCIEDDRVEK